MSRNGISDLLLYINDVQYLYLMHDIFNMYLKNKSAYPILFLTHIELFLDE